MFGNATAELLKALSLIIQLPICPARAVIVPLLTLKFPPDAPRSPSNCPLAADISPLKVPSPTIESPPVNGALNIAVPAEL
jgi:hypothetical protein